MHWTYRKNENKLDDLSQGDILKPSGDLLRIVREIHPPFAAPEYLGFQVLTQTCDLVRRDGECKVFYISLAVIRSFASMLPEFLRAVCRPVSHDIFTDDRKREANQLIARILNQNEQSLGVFYLHPDADSGIAEQAVALLRVSVALSAEHYDALVDSRCGRLCDQFENKLGWLVGNLYSRIGTPDWPSDELRRLTRDAEKIVEWVDAQAVIKATEDGVEFADTRRDEIQDQLKPYKPKSPRDRIADSVEATVKRVLDAPTTTVLRKSIDDAIRSERFSLADVDKQALADAILGAIKKVNAALPTTIRNRLLNDSEFAGATKRQ